ncbi:MAG TPA: prephenate dehydrogenase/arogenate dehydrogenase family protein [Victivallales bacterium]|nr:prephenate dehydrogenase/arogenate dehydrogenase family protein [Victivallales bacterium]HRR28225.1 prephenate dehydrogenase/arogenate dehydrogenase family protein [Victivallales bacterium]HRU00709.1 prephenate dehydrogenase/arogenate dehydrogenase family protein [Victivallales bacterium]
MVLKREENRIQNIGIIGLGLLGTSLGLSLHGKYKRIGWARRKESLDYAMKINSCDEVYVDVKDVLLNSDIVVLCLPVKTIIKFSKENLHHFAEGIIVTDIGSVKRKIVGELEELFLSKGIKFVGSHPMAGSEQSGAEAAREDIYQNAIVFLTPTERTDNLSLQIVSAMWEATGAKTINISSEKHDEVVAMASHLPHISAAVLAKTILSADEQKIISLACAGGFRDSTRVAISSPEMWNEIIEFNYDNILLSLTKLENEICEIRNAIENKDFDKIKVFLEIASDLRKKWQKERNNDLSTEVF